MTTVTLPSYPFDPTGTLASCRITGEQQTLSGANSQDYYFVVPKIAPFFKEGLVLKLKNGNDLRDMVENVDYYLSHEFYSASQACAKQVFGSISILRTDLTGILILTYQTVGGDWVIDDAKIAEIMSDRAHNPRTITWEEVANPPYAFPPVDHPWDLVDLVGGKEVVEAIGGIEAALRASTGDGLELHKADKNNPHGVTAAIIDAYTRSQAQQQSAQAAAAAVLDHAGQIDPHSQYLTLQRGIKLINTMVGTVRQPRNVSPAAQATNVSTTPTLSANGYRSLYEVAQTGAQFQASNKQDFSQILVDSGVLGAVSSWAVPSGLSANNAYFWRCRFRDADNVWSEYSEPTNFATGSVLISQPSITSPTPGQIGVPVTLTLTGSVFAMVGGVDTHASSDWEVWTGAGGSGTRVFNLSGSSAAKTQAAIPAGTLSPNTNYYARVRYTGASSGTSGWSTEVNFQTAGIVSRPGITAPASGDTNIGETPTIKLSNFAVTGGTDTHASSDYQIWTGPNGTGTKVFELMNSTTDKLQTTVPVTKLSVSTTYYARARHTGAALGASDWSPDVSFTTGPLFLPTVIGQPFGGGYYFGKIKEGTDTYALIVAPKSTEFFGVFAGSDVPQASSRLNGLLNTLAYGAQPASVKARQMTTGGYNDWYLPAADELELAYRNLKPTAALNTIGSTSANPSGFNGVNPNSVPVGAAYTNGSPAQSPVAAFQDSNAESLSGAYGSSSAQIDTPSLIAIQNFTGANAGAQSSLAAPTSMKWRAIRRVKL